MTNTRRRLYDSLLKSNHALKSSHYNLRYRTIKNHTSKSYRNIMKSKKPLVGGVPTVQCENSEMMKNFIKEYKKTNDVSFNNLKELEKTSLIATIIFDVLREDAISSKDKIVLKAKLTLVILAANKAITASVNYHKACILFYSHFNGKPPDPRYNSFLSKINEGFTRFDNNNKKTGILTNELDKILNSVHAKIKESSSTAQDNDARMNLLYCAVNKLSSEKDINTSKIFIPLVISEIEKIPGKTPELAAYIIKELNDIIKNLLLKTPTEEVDKTTQTTKEDNPQSNTNHSKTPRGLNDIGLPDSTGVKTSVDVNPVKDGIIYTVTISLPKKYPATINSNGPHGLTANGYFARFIKGQFSQSRV